MKENDSLNLPIQTFFIKAISESNECISSCDPNSGAQFLQEKQY